MSIGVDPKCFELAQHFLDGDNDITPENVEELAEALQQAAEDYLHTLSALRLAEQACKDDDEQRDE